MHEITMYYPMRAVRTREYKLIWNLSHEQQCPEAADLWNSPTWQGILKRGDDRMGARTIAAYLHRPEYELYDLRTDPDETRNLAADPRHKTTLAELQARLRSMMERTKNPWTIEFRGAKAG